MFFISHFVIFLKINIIFNYNTKLYPECTSLILHFYSSSDFVRINKYEITNTNILETLIQIIYSLSTEGESKANL